MKYETLKIPYKGKQVLLKIPDLADIEGGIDTEKLTYINEDLLMAELITFPVILNRVGLLLAEAEFDLAKAKLDMKVEEASLKKRIRNEYRDFGEKYTEKQLDEEVLSHSKYKAFNLKYITIEKRKSIINSLYWSAKDKSDNLKKLAEKISSDELVIDKMVTEINGVKIFLKDNLIK